jgi:DNA polymerase IV
MASSKQVFTSSVYSGRESLAASPDADRRGEPKKIIHLDMDAFFAAVEQRDNPALRGRPVIVGGSPDRRGVVATCSYEARRFGVHSAMASARALRLCPEAVFIRPRFAVYRAVSAQLRGIFLRVTDAVEMLSLDEAYLDVSGSGHCQGSATRMAGMLKRRVLSQTGLVVSAGVSYNKFLAKLASEHGKPDGLHIIPPGAGEAYVAGLPIGRFHGVGPATEARMHALGIRNGADLRAWPLLALQRSFGARAQYFHQAAQGIDPRPVQAVRERRSFSTESTFADDLNDSDRMRQELERQAASVAQALEQRGLRARTLIIKVRYADFSCMTRSCTHRMIWSDAASRTAALTQLLAATEAPRRPVRLLGVAAAGLEPTPDAAEPAQLGWDF